MTAGLQGHETPAQRPPRRIALCITDLDVGGAEQCLVQVACGLDRRDWSPHVFCLSRRGALVDRLEQQDIPCTCLNWRGWRDAWRVAAFARRLRVWRPDLLQTFLFHGNVVGRIAGRLAGVPVIVSGIRVAEREQRWHVRLERLTRGLVDHHVCVSQAVAEFSIHAAHLRPDMVSVIPNGVDVGRFAGASPLTAEELGVPPGTQWIIAVGRLHPQKGHLLLVEAVAPLLRAHPEWRLMIVGEGPLRSELESRIRSLGCGSQVLLAGFRDDVPRLLKTASLMVLPSLWEGQPNVVLEALAAGLPVVATDVEGVRDVVQDGVTGLLVPPANVSALRAGVASLLGSTERRQKLSCGAHVASQHAVTTQSAARMYVDLYRRLLDSRGC